MCSYPPNLATMRTLCYHTPFGGALYHMLDPADISSFLHATYLSLTKAQKRMYMQMWRFFFTDKSLFDHMVSLGFELSLVGADLAVMVGWVVNPNSRSKTRRRLEVVVKLSRPMKERPGVTSPIPKIADARASDEMINCAIQDDWMSKKTHRDGVDLLHLSDEGYPYLSEGKCEFSLLFVPFIVSHSTQTNMSNAEYTWTTMGNVIDWYDCSKGRLHKCTGTVATLCLNYNDDVHMHSYLINGLGTSAPALTLVRSGVNKIPDEYVYTASYDIRYMLMNRFSRLGV